ncbi:hypothetical protein OJF2_37480 [Aquisphaera giovannonii]|uniref:PIN domain-containing protein n=1 Tax=Aquisphaera giovannonii TaxID=406548 RepID=A0A5B9W593_9BACT|nr:type II toxin-antitoxin system VapC family toxin [Aquisphaera giovannonii]QEH35201.1 hypothetical protein OJF2_37480 [Aquisphaera giovannonii]
MRLLLDTHTFLWFLLGDLRLSAAARVVIEDPSNDIEISPARTDRAGARCVRPIR